MTEPNPTPEEPNSPAAPDENTPSPERDGFFRRVRQQFKPEVPPVHPSEAEEIVIDLPPIRRNTDEGA
jgi:hypothetical protein